MAAKAIMVQGTMSNAGKSLLAAGLCRIFHEDGYRVAPFKSQSMALNSFITKEGLEMGRAQVVQAEAAGIEPSVRMNPILLKPTTDMGSQVIVMGRPVGNMEAREYFSRKKSFVPQILEAYRSLAAENDIIVIEGAGSPAEINLKTDDIVNMGMARMADAPVLLAGDIDRGGVFAQLYGTVALLPKEEQDRIAGLVINKFRGDPSLLDSGLKELTRLTGKPVLGVVPYMQIHLDDEDSLSSTLSDGIGTEKGRKPLLDLAVIRLPKISNFTDFQAFFTDSDVEVRYVSSPSELGTPDAVILPGTKSTIQDLLWLRSSGLENEIRRAVGRGSFLFGICGGYQMMGLKISDPTGAEWEGEIDGMRILNEVTVFSPDKTMRQYTGRTHFAIPALSDRKITGYEVHMGRTSAADPASFSDGNAAGARLHAGAEETDMEPGSGKGTSGRSLVSGSTADAAGTYVHGIFDEEDFRDAFLGYLASRKGIRREDGGQSWKAYKEEQMKILSSTLRKALDMDTIYRLVR